MKRAFTLAIIASVVASPAMAGDTFVRNQTVHRTNRTETSLKIDTVINSNRTEHYDSYSEKIFFDGNMAKSASSSNTPDGLQQQFGSNNSTLKLSNLALDNDNYADAYGINGLTIHRSGSSLTGTFIEDTNTRVFGTVYSVVNETFRSHETTAGVR